MLQKQSFADSVRASAYVVLGCVVVVVSLMRTRLPVRRATGPYAAPAPDIKAWFREIPYLTAMFGCVCIFYVMQLPLWLTLYAW